MATKKKDMPASRSEALIQELDTMRTDGSVAAVRMEAEREFGKEANEWGMPLVTEEGYTINKPLDKMTVALTIECKGTSEQVMDGFAVAFARLAKALAKK